MIHWKRLVSSGTLIRGAACALFSASLFACVIEDGPPRRVRTRTAVPSSPDAPSESSGAGAPDEARESADSEPMQVVIDTDQVMNADPGQGVGIFTEYATGGHFRIWWTCDTLKSGQACDVSLAASVTEGTIGALETDQLGSGTAVATSVSRVEARVTTTDQVHAIAFTTTPGAVVTVAATVGGLRQPGPNESFFFFVQNGQINGGYTGPLTNPLQLKGDKP